MAAGLMIYGATGYTGKLLVEEALAQGLAPVIAGRDPRKLARLGERTGLETRCFALDQPRAVAAALEGIGCVLHAAGPFAVTAPPMIDACLARKAHYLDITGEMTVFLLAESLCAQAEAAGVMLLPGVGWDVVPSDCLARRVADRVSQPLRLRIGLKSGGGASRGSIRTGLTIVAMGARARRDGQIVQPDDQQPRSFDFGAGPETCAPIPMGDIVTAWKSTRIPNIDVFLAIGEAGSPFELDVDTLPDGPTPQERDAARSYVCAEVDAADGRTARSLIDTASGYAYTAKSGIEVARRVLAGDFKPGFQTPASAYGPELAVSFGQARFIDLA